MPHSINVNPGVPAIPDIVIDDRNLQQGYDALKEAVELLAGVRGDPNNRALTVGEATEDGQTELFQTNITLTNAAASQESVRLSGDVAGTGLFDGNGAVVVPTALQLPNIIRIDGGAPGTNYTSQIAGPYGIENVPTGGTTGQVLGKLSAADGDYDWITQTGGGGGGSAITFQDDGATLSLGLTKLNFVGFSITEPVADEFTITFGPPSNTSDVYTPGYNYSKVDNDTFTADLVNAVNLFNIGRRLRFEKDGNFDFGVIASRDFNSTNANDTTVNMTMEGADTIPAAPFEVSLVTAAAAWSPIATDPFSGDIIRDICTGAISGVQWWVAVGDNGKLYTSTNAGASWTSRTSGTTSHLRACTYDSNLSKFYVGGENSAGTGVYLAASTNGSSWSSVTTGISSATGDHIFSLQYNAPQDYLLMGVFDSDASAGDQYIAISADPTAWTARTGNANPRRAAGVQATESVSTGSSNAWWFTSNNSSAIYSSETDSTASTEEVYAQGTVTALLAHQFPNSPFSTSTYIIAGMNGGDINYNRQSVAAILDDVTLTAQVNHFAWSKLHARIVAVANSGQIAYLDETNLGTVDSWTSVSNGFDPLANILSVAFNEVDGMFVAVADNGQICRSTNGTN